MAPKEYRRLLEAIRSSSLEMAPDCEITLEANPEDVSVELMREFRSVGINRVSLGAQSLVDEDLILLGRPHNASCSIRAVHAVKEGGIDNISIDLMFELPNQSLARWQKCLETVATLPLTHLSLYNLTFEPHTVFFRHKEQLLLQLPSEEERLKMLEIAVALLESFGLVRYEISAFAKEGLRSCHNMGYWTSRPFLGFGPSAFSYWEGARFSNTLNFSHYLSCLEQNRPPVDFEERLPFPRNLQELFAIALRPLDGVDLRAFTEQHGKLPEVLAESIDALIGKGLLNREDNRIQLTSLGQLFYDTVASEII